MSVSPAPAPHPFPTPARPGFEENGGHSRHCCGCPHHGAGGGEEAKDLKRMGGGEAKHLTSMGGGGPSPFKSFASTVNGGGKAPYPHMGVMRVRARQRT